MLLECEGDAVDLSGDMGAVGRFTVDRDNELSLDLKGMFSDIGFSVCLHFVSRGFSSHESWLLRVQKVPLIGFCSEFYEPVAQMLGISMYIPSCLDGASRIMLCRYYL